MTEADFAHILDFATKSHEGDVIALRFGTEFNIGYDPSVAPRDGLTETLARCALSRIGRKPAAELVPIAREIRTFAESRGHKFTN